MAKKETQPNPEPIKKVDFQPASRDDITKPADNGILIIDGQPFRVRVLAPAVPAQGTLRLRTGFPPAPKTEFTE